MSKNGEKCPVCGEGHLDEVIESKLLEWSGNTYEVNGFKRSLCNECEAELVTPFQSRENKRLIMNFRRQHEGLLSGKEIRNLRSKFHLTQVVAATIFGGGETAFSKYESGDVIQSGPMDRLLRVANHVPGVIVWLCNNYAAGQKYVATKHINFYWNDYSDIAIVAEGTVTEVPSPPRLRLISSFELPTKVVREISFKKENHGNETEPAKLRSLSTA